MDSKFYQEGYKLALENSMSLHSNSELIAENKNYGLACSINILAAEEALKSIYIMLKHFNQNYEIDDYKKVFNSHTYKHEKIKNIMLIYDIETTRIKELFNAYQPIFEIYEQSKPNLSDENKTAFENLEKINNRYKKYNSKNIDKILDWLNEANNDKNNGLYVGQKSNKWTSPLHFPEQKFNRENEYTREIIKIAQEFEYTHLQLKELLP